MTDLLKILLNDMKSSCLLKKSVPEKKKEKVFYLLTSSVDKSILASPI